MAHLQPKRINMRVSRIVQLLLLLLLLERSSVVVLVVVSSVERGWRTQITSPWNIKGAVPPPPLPTKRSHEEDSRLNSLGENSPALTQLRVGDNLKALHEEEEEEECISIRNPSYVICPTFDREFREQLGDTSRIKRSRNLREDSNDDRGLSENMRNFLSRTQSQLRGLLNEIDTVLEENEERKERERYRIIDLDEILKSFERDLQKSPRKRHVSHHHSSSDEWVYQPQSYVIYDFNTPMVLLQWPTISPEYEREIYNLFSKSSRNRDRKNRRKNYHRKHMHDYGDEYRDSEDYEDYRDEKGGEVEGRMGKNFPTTKSPNAPLSHMLQHIYPPWPNKTSIGNRYKKP